MNILRCRHGMKTMICRPLLYFLFCAVLTSQLFAAEKAPSLTPVATVKAFLNAVADVDSTKIKALAMPNSKLKSLYSPPPTKQEQDALRLAANDDLRVLMPGEMVPIENGMMTVPPPSNNLLFVQGKNLAYPFPVQRANDVWKVNAGPMIAAREKAKKSSP
jgi:hypothetical protein